MNAREFAATAALLTFLFAGCGQPPRDAALETSAVTPDAASPSRGNGDEAALDLAEMRLVDLTHTFDAQTIYWPTEDGFQLEKAFDGMTEKGYYYSANRFTTAEHGGTHIDAPVHFYQDRQTVDAIPLARLVGAGVLVDVADKCAADPDYQISVADLRGWEEQQQRTLAESIVLLRTGYSAHWPGREKYLGTLATGPQAVAQLHFPGLAPEAARWLAEQRAIKAVGIDTASIDYGQSTHFESHVTLFQNNIPAFENVAALDQLPVAGFTVIALPMKIGGGSGGPLRIVALLSASSPQPSEGTHD